MGTINIDSFALCLNPPCHLEPKFFNDVKTTVHQWDHYIVEPHFLFALSTSHYYSPPPEATS